jgi:prolyl-tRNA editing enzyme YbaK/EbsC (Cys-tRNA(Pro) deacylase)
MSGSNRLDPDRLTALTAAQIRKADAETVRAATGYAIGGVPPLGFPTGLPTYIDRELLQYQTVWAAAGTPRHVFAVTPADLVRVTNGLVVELRLEEV